MPTKAEKVARQNRLVDLGVSIHTALRKACDSKATSILYNIVCVLPHDIWVDWLDAVAEQLDKHPDKEMAIASITSMSERYDYGQRLYAKNPRKAHTFWRTVSEQKSINLHIFHLCLDLCTMDDYRNMLVWVFEEEQEEE